MFWEYRLETPIFIPRKIRRCFLSSMVMKVSPSMIVGGRQLIIGRIMVPQPGTTWIDWHHDMLKGTLSTDLPQIDCFFFKSDFPPYQCEVTSKNRGRFFHQAQKTGQWSSVLKGSLLDNKRLIPNVTSTERRRGKQDETTWTSETSSDFRSFVMPECEMVWELKILQVGSCSALGSRIGCCIWRRTAVPTRAHLKLPYGVLPEMAWYHIIKYHQTF